MSMSARQKAGGTHAWPRWTRSRTRIVFAVARCSCAPLKALQPKRGAAGLQTNSFGRRRLADASHVERPSISRCEGGSTEGLCASWLARRSGEHTLFFCGRSIKVKPTSCVSGHLTSRLNPLAKTSRATGVCPGGVVISFPQSRAVNLRAVDGTRKCTGLVTLDADDPSATV